MLSLRTASPSTRRGERQPLIRNSPSRSKALPLSPITRVSFAVKQASAPKTKQATQHHGQAPPKHDTPLSTQEALRRNGRFEQDSSNGATHPPNGLRVESPSPVHSDPKIFAGIPSVTTNSKLRKTRLSGALSQYHQSMGNNASSMLRKSRSKMVREQADSPETTVSAFMSPIYSLGYT